MMTFDGSARDFSPRALERLTLEVGGRHVEAELFRFPRARSGGGRQPRWMLRIDRGPLSKGPLTWDGVLDEEVERTAIAEYLRDRQLVAAVYRAGHADRMRRMNESSLRLLADALGVPPGDLLAGPTDGE